MAEYLDDYIPSYNMFIAQNKQYKDILTPEEWNTLINTLSLQADNTAEQVKKIHDYLIETGGTNMVHVGSSPPDTVVINKLWFD